MTHKEIQKLMDSPMLNVGEKELLNWQYQRQGDFMAGLWAAISHADLSNLLKLGLGFPLEVRAYRDFSHTGIFKRKCEAILTDRGMALAQACGSHWRIYSVRSPSHDLAIIPFDTFHENITEAVERIQDQHNILILNWSPLRGRMIL